MFGKSKEDTSQDKQISEILKWIQMRDKHFEILIKNNNAFVQNENDQRQFNKQITASINSLVAKDKQHDQKDAEHDNFFKALKGLAQAVEAETDTE